MVEKLNVPIASVRVPVKRGKTLDAAKAESIAEDMIENGQTTPIRIRAEGAGYVLVEGLHRLEALRMLGEAEVVGYLVRAQQH